MCLRAHFVVVRELVFKLMGEKMQLTMQSLYPGPPPICQDTALDGHSYSKGGEVRGVTQAQAQEKRDTKREKEYKRCEQKVIFLMWGGCPNFLRPKATRPKVTQRRLYKF